MKAQALVTQDHGETAGQTLNELMEECEMKTANAITMVNTWLRTTPGKVLGALAVGGLIMVAAVVTPSPALADEPSRPLSAQEADVRPFLSALFSEAELSSIVGETGVAKSSHTQEADIRPFLSALFSEAELSSIVEETGVGRGSYTQEAYVRPFLSALFSEAELSSIVEETGVGTRPYIQEAYVGPFLTALFSAAELSSIIAGDYSFRGDFPNNH